MKVHLYEKIWRWGVGAVLALFFAITAVAAVGGAVHPPSHVETIDPSKVFGDARFRQPGVSVDARGRVHARLIGMTFAWVPTRLEVPAATPVTFHITAVDVVHGFQIVRTNGQAMVIPGYISRFTTSFDEPGEYLIVCNEYCGVGHHTMASRLVVVPKGQWRAGTPAAPSSAVPTQSHDAGAAHGND
jgi:cytochrome c oxidase subunit 2